MPRFPEFLIIETYGELAMVLAVLALAGLGGWLWLARRRRRAARGALTDAPPRAPSMQRPATPDRRVGARPLDFDSLATVIAGLSDRVQNVSRTQSDAAVKLDSTEMAVNRLQADLAALREATPAPVALPAARNGLPPPMPPPDALTRAA